MSTAEMTYDDAPTLPFAQSESKKVGAEGPFMKMLRDNAPRIIGVLKLIGDGFIMTAGIQMGTVTAVGLILYGLFSMPGRLILLAYGTKDHERKLAEEEKQTHGAHHARGYAKALHPSQYPIESSAGLSILAETSGFATAAMGFFASPDPGQKVYAAINAFFEIFAIGLYGNILFGKEKTKEEREKSSNPAEHGMMFAQSDSKPVGVFGKLHKVMKDNPVLTSSLIGIAVCIGLGISGWGFLAKPTFYVIGCSIFLASYILQAALVRKNDFNIEGAKDDKAAKTAQDKPASFQERVATQRSGDTSPQLA